MTTEVLISVLGAITAIIVSIIGAWLSNKNNITLQLRKLKEQHYISYIEALHNIAAENNNKEAIKNYVFSRDKLFIMASEDVIKKMIKYEEEAVGKKNNLHDAYLTEVIKAIRKDLRINDKNFPLVYLKKS